VLQVFKGSCHCGAIAFELATQRPVTAWAVRACQCSFCRSHGVRMTSDPKGTVRFHVADASLLQRYQFGLRSADFLLCRHCGVYVAAVTTSARGQFATLNTNVLRPAIEAPAAAPMSYEGESLEQKLGRREERWTPAIGVI
jgi:hypothetical protein